MSRFRLTRPLVLDVAMMLFAAKAANAQTTLTGVIHMDGGYQHECAVRDTGEVDCWGLNADGELGDGTLVDRSVPTRVAVEGGIAIDVAAGLYHTCIIDGGGGVQCWGNNYVGQVGNGTTSFAETHPQRVIGLDAGVSAIGTGSDHSCAIVSGAAKCWGFNGDGELGTGFASDPIPTPQDVEGLAGEVSDISGSYASTCAVVDGAAKCWGSNQYGTLGNATNDDSLVAVDVVGLDQGVTRISLAGETACAVVDEAAKCWGDGTYGQLGDGWYAPSNTPVDVIGLSAHVIDIAVSDYGACATTTTGMYCWGSVPLGDFGPVDVAYEPVPVAFDSGGIAAMGLGSGHACAAQDGVAHCWGDNHRGQLGVGAIPQSSLTPNPIPELAASVDSLAVGSQYACAISGSSLDCWGDNSYGQLGDGSYNAQGSPVPVVGLTGTVSSVAVASTHTCAIVDGAALCWGSNDRGELGDGSFVTRPTPLPVGGLSSGVVAIAVGTSHSCAIVEGGTVKCWGEGDAGALGNDNPADQPLPVDVIGISSGATALALGYDYSCAIVDGGAKCWGDGGGQGTPWVPTDVIGLASGVTAIAAEIATTCAIANGGAYCWGYNEFGQVGDGTFDYRFTPVAVVGLDSGVLSIDVTYEHTCARTTGGVKCWGSNEFGELGTGATSDPVNVPVDATIVPADASGVGAGAYFGCVVDGGAVSCWGDGYSGSLGTGGVPSWAVPLQVHGVDAVFASGFDG
jgi:alpha-tubulin suppressor-like RCC1 family protein